MRRLNPFSLYRTCTFSTREVFYAKQSEEPGGVLLSQTPHVVQGLSALSYLRRAASLGDGISLSLAVFCFFFFSDPNQQRYAVTAARR